MPPSTRDWADTYLAQARADLDAARLLTGAAPSTFAMLLQMVFEKLAKAALLRSRAMSVDAVTRTHRAASRTTLQMRCNRNLIAPLGGPRPWKDVLDVVDALERAHPALARGGPQLEYPWTDAEDAVLWPEAHLAIASQAATERLGAEVLKFAGLLDQCFDEIFP